MTRRVLPCLLGALGLAALPTTMSCTKSAPPIAAVDAGDVDAAQSSFESADSIALEDARQSSDIPMDALATRDLVRKRNLARTLARIADDRSAEILREALPVDDPETLAYVAYGLGFTCAKREEKHVSALVARFGSLKAEPIPSVGSDVRGVFLRAIGRCGGELAETTLRSVLAGSDDADRLRATYALGDMASRRHTLSPESVSALLAAAAGDQSHPALASAFYPLSRIKSDAELPILAAAKAVLAQPGTERVFAIRALSKAGPSAVPELLRIVKGGVDGASAAAANPSPSSAGGFRPEERAEAARSLGLLGALAQPAVGEALTALLPAKDPFAVQTLGGPIFGVLVNLLDAVKDDPPKALQTALFAVAAYRAPGDPGGSLGRRLGTLRCKAAAALAKGSIDAEVLASCDTKGTKAWEDARLSALVKKPLLRERKTAWVELTHSSNIRVREAALEAYAEHPELSDAGRTALAEALRSGHAGLVATAAELLFKKPALGYSVSDRAKKAALDPHAPPPVPFEGPEKDVDAQVATALREALAKSLPEDAVETKTLLLDAAVALHVNEAAPLAKKQCQDANVTVRRKAQAALRMLGENATCEAQPGTHAAKVDTPWLAIDTRVVFRTDAGALGITLSPVLAPMATTRIVALVKQGFYKNIVVHRVVPAFVVQFGDPGGDGYGGSGTLLRCETAPKPFEPLSVGLALAGRDTASSQLFVTLSRAPHLDGEYTKVGQADGDWASVAEGDVISDASVLE